MKKGQLTRSQLHAPEGQDNIHFWKGVCARQFDALKSYKKREESIVMELGKLAKNSEYGDLIAQNLLGQTLAVAKKRVDDREEALLLAVGLVQANCPDHIGMVAVDKLKALCPDLFEAPEPAAPAAGQEKA